MSSGGAADAHRSLLVLISSPVEKEFKRNKIINKKSLIGQ